MSIAGGLGLALCGCLFGVIYSVIKYNNQKDSFNWPEATCTVSAHTPLAVSVHSGCSLRRRRNSLFARRRVTLGGVDLGPDCIGHEWTRQVDVTSTAFTGSRLASYCGPSYEKEEKSPEMAALAAAGAQSQCYYDTTSQNAKLNNCEPEKLQYYIVLIGCSVVGFGILIGVLGVLCCAWIERVRENSCAQDEPAGTSQEMTGVGNDLPLHTPEEDAMTAQEYAMTSLMNMGYDQQTSQAALDAHNGDLGQAIESLALEPKKEEDLPAAEYAPQYNPDGTLQPKVPPV